MSAAIPEKATLNGLRERIAKTTAAPTTLDGRTLWTDVLTLAARLDVTDVHVEPQAGGARLRVRVDGALHDVAELSAPVTDRITQALKHMSGMIGYVRSQPQDGRLHIADPPLTVRVATVPVLHGEKLTLRLLAPASRILPLAALGMSASQLDHYVARVAAASGLTLCVGPAGSGKSTTLYATLLSLSQGEGRRMSVATIEDPVEYEVPHFNQTPVNLARGLTFAAGLRSILRHDPNAILVGEIRDRETAATAFQAALSGHLVMSTMHGADTTGAIVRLLDMGIEPDVIGGALSVLVAQRLVPRVCAECATCAAGSGGNCEACDGTGRRGRVGVFELLAITDEVRQSLRERAAASAFRDGLLGPDLGASLAAAIAAGFVPPDTPLNPMTARHAG